VDIGDTVEPGETALDEPGARGAMQAFDLQAEFPFAVRARVRIAAQRRFAVEYRPVASGGCRRRSGPGAELIEAPESL